MKSPSECKHFIWGFTLIELVVVIGILALLTLLAWPQWSSYVIRIRREEGHHGLLLLASAMERYHAAHQSYEGAADMALSDTRTPDGWYRLGVRIADQDQYLLEAVPQNQQGRADTRCQTLLLDSQGHQDIAPGPSGNPVGTATACW